MLWELSPDPAGLTLIDGLLVSGGSVVASGFVHPAVEQSIVISVTGSGFGWRRTFGRNVTVRGLHAASDSILIAGIDTSSEDQTANLTWAVLDSHVGTALWDGSYSVAYGSRIVLGGSTFDASGNVYLVEGDDYLRVHKRSTPLSPVDPDSDGDGAVDVVDNCPAVANIDQSDADADGIGDVCDPFPLKLTTRKLSASLISLTPVVTQTTTASSIGRIGVRAP